MISVSWYGVCSGVRANGLVQLWNTLHPDIVLTQRVSPQWTLIGFQGNDPATDFRGMGLLGLLNLL